MTLIDFDGTIVDLWPRYHRVFCTLTNAQVDLHTYKKAKQVYKRDESLARYLGVELPEDYFPRKAVLLEETEYLALDRLLVCGNQLLRFMEQKNAWILTARRRPDHFLWELDYLGLSALRDRAICVNGSKTAWVEQHVPGEGIMIGDDVKDLQVVVASNLQAIMVLTGLCTAEDFRSTGLPHTLRQSLEEYMDRG